jgi:hypothetical protein
MDQIPASAGAKSVTIVDTTIPVIEYQGQRVITLAMVDRLHRRPDGTAKRNLADNKERFVEGKHFYRIDFSKKCEFHTFGINIPPRGLMVVTETGYLMLVKSFTDDLAWQVQCTLVKTYFRTKQETLALGSAVPPLQGRVLLTFSQGAPVSVRILGDDEALISRDDILTLKRQLMDDNLRCVVRIQEFCNRTA